MKCFECGKKIKGEPIRAESSRHLTSPNSINWGVKTKKDCYYQYYCSETCHKLTDKKRYRWYAEVDRNASDSECFEHDHWEGKMRIGKCKITGERVEVEPLQPGNNSGQPKACYDHFRLHLRYL